jgi:hypothetical protein
MVQWAVLDCQGPRIIRATSVSNPARVAMRDGPPGLWRLFVRFPPSIGGSVNCGRDGEIPVAARCAACRVERRSGSSQRMENCDR